MAAPASSGPASSGHASPSSPRSPATGRFVAFAEPDAYGDGNIHVQRHDQTGKTSLVTVGVDGKAAGGRSQNPSLSANGRFVAFSSDATNLTRRKPIAARNEFVRDMKAGKTQQVNVTPRRQAGKRLLPPSLGLRRRALRRLRDRRRRTSSRAPGAPTTSSFAT